MVRFFARALFVVAVVCTAVCSVVAAESAPAEVSAAGKLSSHLSVVKDLVPFTFTFHNGTAKELEDLRIVNLPAEYEMHDLCINSPHSCLTAKDLKVANYRIAKVVAAGSTLVIWGNFIASPPHKPRTLFVVLQWGTRGQAIQVESVQNSTVPKTGNNDATPPVIYSSLAVDLGDNEVQSRGWAWVTDYSSIVLLPLAIPIVLAACTYLFNLFASWSARRTEIWKQMLPAIHGYSTKFYMPMSMAADALAGELEDSNPEVAFFFFLLLLRIYLDSTAEIGGFYFKDHRGENVANKCWYGIWNMFFPDGRKSAIYVPSYAAAELVDPHFTFEDFARLYLVRSDAQITFANFDIQQCWELFCDEIPQRPQVGPVSKTFCDLTLLLQAFSTTLDCEVNRPYKYWYPVLVPVKVKSKVLELLQEMAKDAKINWWRRYTYFLGWEIE